MKGRAAIARTPLKAGLTVAGWGIVAILATVVLSACSSAGSGTSLFSPSASGSETATATATATATGTTSPTGSPSPTASETATSTASPTPTPTFSPTPTPTFSPIPTTAPVTGGGGTAGLQDTVLFAIGALALLAGTGSIIYRKKLTRDR